MAWLIEVSRHLKRQPSVRGEPGDEGRQQGTVPWNPLKCGVADDYVHTCLGPPVAQILELESHSRPVSRAAFLIISGDESRPTPSVGPAIGRRGSELARSTAEIDHHCRFGDVDSVQKIHKRSRALIRELEVSAGVPWTVTTAPEERDVPAQAPKLTLGSVRSWSDGVSEELASDSEGIPSQTPGR